MHVSIAYNNHDIHEISNRSLEEKGIRDDVKVMIGGAPITEKICRGNWC